jgi:hypothetical protein
VAYTPQQQWLRSRPRVAQIIGIIMLLFAAGMFASNFLQNQRRIDVPHAYVIAGIILAIAWLVSLVFGVIVRYRTGATKVSFDRSRHLYPAFALGLTVFLGIPARQHSNEFLFPPRWQVVGDAVGAVASIALALMLLIAVLRKVMQPPNESIAEPLAE